MRIRKDFFLAPIPGKIPAGMLPEGTALVLEGGGLRGFYSAGVFEAFMDADIMFPYIIAVSAGAANVLSYVSGQQGRNRQVLEHCVADKRYISKRNLIRNGSLFGMDFVFHEVPQKHVLFDWDTFNEQHVRLLVGALNCEVGRSVWFEKKDIDPGLDAIIASCSIPVLSPIRRFKNVELLDGGVSDPIPIEKSIADGNTFHVIVLTRNEGYRKKPFKHHWFLSAFYRKYPKVVEAILIRHDIYNRQIALCEQLEKEGKAVIIRPRQPIQARGNVANTEVLLKLHDEGRQDGAAALKSILHRSR